MRYTNRRILYFMMSAGCHVTASRLFWAPSSSSSCLWSSTVLSCSSSSCFYCTTFTAHNCFLLVVQYCLVLSCHLFWKMKMKMDLYGSAVRVRLKWNISNICNSYVAPRLERFTAELIALCFSELHVSTYCTGFHRLSLPIPESQACGVCRWVAGAWEVSMASTKS